MHFFQPETIVRLEQLLSAEGLLATHYKMQRRKGQHEMVMTIAHSLLCNKGCLIEASTGIGKTLAYLLPAAEFIQQGIAHGVKPRVIVSTASKGLQDQLYKKDLPLISSIYPGIKADVWKGASNYLCINRLQQYLTSGKDRDLRTEALELWRTRDILEKLPRGLRDELPFEVSDQLWFEICGASPCCLPSNHLICYKHKSFQTAKESNLLCVNHSFLATLALHTPFIHPAKPKPEELLLIMDEGHELHAQIRATLNKDFSFHTLKNKIKTLQSAALKDTFLKTLDAFVSELADSIPLDDEVRLTREDTHLVSVVQALGKFMGVCAGELKKDFDWIKDKGFFIDDKDEWEMEGHIKGLEQSSTLLVDFTTNFPKDCMLELSRDMSRKGLLSQTKLALRPFSFHRELQHIYSHSSYPPIITSATLFNGDMGLTLKSFCLPKERMNCVQISSDFNYLKTIRGFCFPDLENPGDPIVLCHWLKHIIPLSSGNALVLFTNKWVMDTVAQEIKAWIKSEGYTFLMQNELENAGKLSQTMKSTPNCVLFGLRSFWTGIDIKGKNLSSLIITRLPFDPPDTYAQAYGQYLQEQGEHPFWEWALPEMINRFRQGIGRLKRDDDDKGLVFILDKRFIHARYKLNIITKLPPIEWTQIREVADLPMEMDTNIWLGTK